MRRLFAHFGYGFPATEASGTTTVRRSPVGWLIVCGALLVAAIVLGTAFMIGQFRERALVNAEREMENTVLLLSRHFDQRLDGASGIAGHLTSPMRIPG